MPKLRISALRAFVEIVFIIFLFYSNLLMGEFTASGQVGKSWSTAFSDVITMKNFEIALVCAIVGFIGFEILRERV